MCSQFVLASDFGSGGCKTVLLNQYGQVVGSASAEYATAYPQPGWVEQNPDDWVQAFVETTRQVLAQSDVSAEAIKMVGFVGVTHNTVLLDKHDLPLRPCILTFDQRSGPQCDLIARRWGDRILQEALNKVSPLWSWPQLLWIKQNEPDIWQATHRILFQKDFVRHRMAPGYFTDTIDTAGTLLFNPISEQWIVDFYADLGLPDTALPTLAAPMDVVSHISPAAAHQTGLLAGTPVIAGTTDTVAEVFGSGLLEPGQGMVKLASVGRLAVVNPDPIRHPHILNYRHVLPDLWYPGSGTKSAATVPRWLRDNLWRTPSFSEMDQAAAQISPGSEGLLFQPHLLGEWAPHWDDRLRANFIGATTRHTQAHFTRAALEGVAFALRAGVEALADLGLPYQEYRLIGGGAKSQLWARIVCDVLGHELLLPIEQDAAYGAALITAVAAGLIDPAPSAIKDLIRIDTRLTPDPTRQAIYNDLFDIYLDADARLVEIAHRLTAFETRPNSASTNRPG